MLILAKKKDYYDGVAGTTGIDKTIVYDRQIIEVDEKDIPVYLSRKPYRFARNDQSPFFDLYYHHLKKEIKKIYPDYAHFVVGFCGKLYVGWKLYQKGKEIYYGNNDVVTTFTYDYDFVKEFVEPKTWGGKLFEDDVNDIKNHNAIDIFREFNSPVFVYDGDYGRTSIDDRYYRHNSKFFINPLLKEYEFYKLFDAFQAFQEIQMFLSGVLGNKEKEIVTVADKYKIEQHGFDYKWSFRKEPENKK